MHPLRSLNAPQFGNPCSSQKVWSILNNLSGRSWHSTRHCPVSADAIASQLVRNRKYEAVIASHLDLSLKKCLTFGMPQHQTQ